MTIFDSGTERCERPGCDRPARHHPHLGGDPFPGWTHLCCRCMDEFMASAGRASDPEDARTGWASWMAEHETTCGALF